MLNLICGLPAMVLWLAVGSYIIYRGARAIRWQRIQYTLPLPLGRRVWQFRGGGAAVLGGVQVVVGGLLLGSLLGVVLNQPTLNEALGAAFCAAVPAYIVLMLLLARLIGVRSRYIQR